MPRVVITGGPGAGKTTLLRALASAGHRTVEESARAVIAERLAQGDSPRPEPGTFAREILRRDIDKYEATAALESWVFFDRGVVEAIGHVHAVTPLPAGELKDLLASYPMHSTVFVLPPWPEIYSTDRERDQTFEESVRVYDGLKSWYAACGYRLNEVPRTSALERAAHVLQTLGATALGSDSKL